MPRQVDRPSPLRAAGLVLLASASIFPRGVAETGRRPDPPQPEQLISEARAISSAFPPEEKADLLLDILATPAGALPTTGRKWSLELFSISKNQLQPGPYRAAIQKNALVDLAKVDPTETAKLFKSQDTPEMLNEKIKMEDYRAWVARALFPKMWAASGRKSLPSIKEFADWLGSTGEYPYVAMTGIVQDVAKFDQAEAEALVSDAVGYYKTSSPFVNRYRELTPFILGVADCVRPPTITLAIEAELDALETDREDSDQPQIRYTIQATNKAGTVQFDQQAEYVVYRLLPLISKLDPQWAKSVQDKYGALKYVPNSPNSGPSRVTGVAVLPGTTSSSSTVSNALDDHRLLQVSTLVDSDPTQAAEVAASIQDPARRAVAQSMLIPAYDKIDANRANNWRDDALHQLDSLPPGKIKLKLLAALATASLEEGKTELALGLFDKAFDLAQTLFSQDLKDNPGKMAYATLGEDDLASLVTSFSRNNKVRGTVIEQTREVHNDVLRAKLLVAAAKGEMLHANP